MGGGGESLLRVSALAAASPVRGEATNSDDGILKESFVTVVRSR